MISKMFKVTTLVYHKEYEKFLYDLRKAGVVHIEQCKSGAADSPELQQMLADYNRYMRLVKSL